MENKPRGIIGLIIVALFIFLGYRYYKDKKSWTMIVCKNKMANGIECYDDSYEIPNFKSEKDCLLEGARTFSKEGFECGKGCKKKDGLRVCSIICNKAGCN
jgi:hypothetical protein